MSDRDFDGERPTRESLLPLWGWLVIGGVGLLLVAGQAVVMVLMTRKSEPLVVTEENYNRLGIGMTEARVTQILGPGADVTDTAFDPGPEWAGTAQYAKAKPGPHKALMWQQGHDHIIVFLAAGKVVAVYAWFTAGGRMNKT